MTIEIRSNQNLNTDKLNEGVKVSVWNNIRRLHDAELLTFGARRNETYSVGQPTLLISEDQYSSLHYQALRNSVGMNFERMMFEVDYTEYNTNFTKRV